MTVTGRDPSGSPPGSADTGRHVWLGGDRLVGLLDGCRLVPAQADEHAGLLVVGVAGQRAVGDVGRCVDGEDGLLIEVLEQVPHEQNDDLVRDDQHPLAVVVPAHLVQQRAQALQHVCPRLPAGRTVVELAEHAAAFGLLGKLVGDTPSCEAVERAELAFAQPLVDGDGNGQPGAFQQQLSRLPRADVGRADDGCRPVSRVHLPDPLPQREGLPLAELGQRDVHVALGQLQAQRILLLGAVTGDVARTLAVPGDPQLHRSAVGLIHEAGTTLRARLLPLVAQVASGALVQHGLVASPAVPRLGPAAAAALRDAFAAAGYAAGGVQQRLGEPAAAALARGEQVPALRATAAGDPLDTLIRLFLLGRSVPQQAARGVLPDVPGLLLGGPEGVRASVDIRPYARDWYVASDHRPNATPVPPDHVIGVGSASLTLVTATVRQPVTTSLDLGTGCGVQALHLAEHSRRVTATDTSPRALALARLSFALSGITRSGMEVELLAGDLWQPVQGRRFDLVVSNPPFVVGPGRLTYRDSGLPGDEVSRRVVAGAAQHLNDGGVAQVLASWLHRRGEDWRERVAGWLPPGCDALVLQREVLDPPAHVALWLDDEGLEVNGQDLGQGDPAGMSTAGAASAYERRYAAWLDDLAAQHTEGIGFGLVVLRHTDGQPSHRLVDARDWAEPLTATRISGWLSRATELREHEALGATRLVRAPGLTLRRTFEPGGEDGWRERAAVLTVPHGLPQDVAVDDVLVQVLAALDSGVPLGVLADLVAAATGEPDLAAKVIPAVRALVEAGHLLPVSDGVLTTG